MFTVYRILNKVTGVSYVGCSKNLKARWKEHKISLEKKKHHNIHLQRAWDKYGEENFTWEIFLECNSEKLMFIEEVNLISNTELTYNIAEGGLGGNKIKSLSEERYGEYLEKCSRSQKARYLRPGEKDKANCFKDLSDAERMVRLKLWSDVKKGKGNGRYLYDSPVLQIDKKTGKVIKEWNDVCEASYSGFERRYIIACCKEKKGYNSHKGYVWKWKLKN
jgi:group I intron endonuclease